MALGKLGGKGGMGRLGSLAGARRAPGYNPITAAGAFAWWDANRADTINTLAALTPGAPVNVSSWTDIVAGYLANQTTTSLQPVYSPTSFNGYPGISFDGIQQYMTCLEAGFLAALPSVYEIWILCQQTAAPADNTERIAVAVGGASLTSGVAISRYVNTGVNRARGRTGTGAASVQSNDATVDFTGYHYARHQMGATTSSLTVDSGTPTTPASVVPGITNTRMRIGCSSSSGPTSYWQGQIVTVLFTPPLTNAQATELGAWL